MTQAKRDFRPFSDPIQCDEELQVVEKVIDQLKQMLSDDKKTLSTMPDAPAKMTAEIERQIRALTIHILLYELPGYLAQQPWHGFVAFYENIPSALRERCTDTGLTVAECFALFDEIISQRGYAMCIVVEHGCQFQACARHADCGHLGPHD